MSILPAPMPLCPNTSASALPVQFSHGMSAVSLNSAYKTILFPLIFTIPEVNASLTSLSSAQMICSSSFISQSLFFLYLSISAQDCTPPTPETGCKYGIPSIHSHFLYFPFTSISPSHPVPFKTLIFSITSLSLFSASPLTKESLSFLIFSCTCGLTCLTNCSE